MSSIIRRDFLKLMGVTGAAATLPFDLSYGADWPSRPVTAVSSTAQGGGADTVMRTLEPLLEERLKATINVVNKTGGTSSIATKYVYSQPSDGYTWLSCPGFNRGVRVLGLIDTKAWEVWQYYGTDTSIASIGVLPDSPIKDMEDLIKRAKEKPGELRMSTNGPGGTWHLAALLLMRATGTKFRIVPYKGGKPATTACLEGEVDVALSGTHEQLPFVKSGQMRNLCVLSAKDLDIQGQSLKSVVGFVPSLEPLTPIGGGHSLALKRDTDPAIVKQLAEAFFDSVGSKTFQEADAKKPRFPDPVVLEDADRRAALWDTIASNLLVEQGLAKRSLEDVGLPKLDDFDSWWPPKGYKPVG